MSYHSEQDLLYGKRHSRHQTMTTLPGSAIPNEIARLRFETADGITYRFFPSHGAAYRAAKQYRARLEWWDGRVWVS